MSHGTIGNVFRSGQELVNPACRTDLRGKLSAPGRGLAPVRAWKTGTICEIRIFWQNPPIYQDHRGYVNIPEVEIERIAGVGAVSGGL